MDFLAELYLVIVILLLRTKTHEAGRAPLSQPKTCTGYCLYPYNLSAPGVSVNHALATLPILAKHQLHSTSRI